MRNTPAGHGEGVECLPGSDIAPYTRNVRPAQTAVSPRRYPHPDSILAKHWFRDGEPGKAVAHG